MVEINTYTPLILPPLAVGLLVAALGLYSWSRREVPGARYFAVACLVWVLALLSSVAETAAADASSKLAWHHYESLWYLAFVVAVACFVLDYVQPGRWLTRRTLLLLIAPALLSALLIVTNGAHYLFWREFVIGADVRSLPSVGGWFALLYAMLLAVVQAAALLWLFVHSPQHRWPVALMLAALVLTRGHFLADVFVPEWRVAPFGAALLAAVAPIAYAVALFGFRIFDPMPAAHRAVLAQMSAGVIVFDTHWRVFGVNAAAGAMLGHPHATARGQTWAQLAPGAPPLSNPNHQHGNMSDFALDRGNTRWYAPALSPLHDFRGLLVGYLLLLTDVTEQHRIQTQLLAQQRALAALHEREQFARDLHDGIAQVVGYASFQVDAAVQLIEDGKQTDAEAQLVRLAAVLQDAHADLRAQIHNLRTSPSAQQPFFTLVQDYLDGFTNNYAIATQLTLGAGLSEVAIVAPDVQRHLSGILQEALANVRKHSGARRAEVTFDAGDDLLRMCIADDGIGFVQESGEDKPAHWGLQFMQERAAEMNGELHVSTSPGAGASIIVEIPWKERQPCV